MLLPQGALRSGSFGEISRACKFYLSETKFGCYKAHHPFLFVYLEGMQGHVMVTSCIESVIHDTVRSPIWGQDPVPDSAIFHTVDGRNPAPPGMYKTL